MAKKVKLTKGGQTIEVDKSAVDLLTSNGWGVGVVANNKPITTTKPKEVKDDG